MESVCWSCRCSWSLSAGLVGVHGVCVVVLYVFMECVWYCAKMADEVGEGIENALNLVVVTTERSGNMKKELKQTIFETVSTLRNLYVKLKTNCDVKTSKIKELDAQVARLRTELQSFSDKTVKVHGKPSVFLSQEPAGPRVNVAPSVDQIQEPAGLRGQGAPSVIQTQGPAGQRVRVGAPSGERERKLYSEAVTNKVFMNKYKLTVKSNEHLPPETIKGLLKSKINPTEIKVGINTFKSLKNGQVLIETNSQKELETLQKDINAKCEGQLEASAHKLRNPRLVIFNIPEEISIGNVEDTLIAQNPDINLKQGDTKAKFSYETRKHSRNIVMEVSAQTRKLLLHKKVKLGWQICTVEDYVFAIRCYKCSRFNHRASDCRGEETCPLCAGNHKLKECTTNPLEYKCINCQSYNKHNQGKTICVNHTSLDKNCPSLQAILEKYRKNTDY